MQVLSYFVNVRDQTFLATVFNNILEGLWSIKQATNACRNKTMNTKPTSAVQYHLDEYIQEKTKELQENAKDMPGTNIFELPSNTLADLVHDISGHTRPVLHNCEHPPTRVAVRWQKLFATDASMCIINTDLLNVTIKFSNRVAAIQAQQTHSAALLTLPLYSGKLATAKKKIDR